MKLSVNKFLFFGLVLIVSAFTPAFSLAQAAPGYNPATDSLVAPKQGNCPPDCGWKELMNLFKRLIDFSLFMAASFAVIGFAYAGFLYLTAFGDMGKVEQAHHMFGTIMTGVFIVLCGWLLVATILKTLGVKDSFSLIDLSKVQILQTP